ncbi:hypothetical protein HOP50_04g30180 [Chloropicon primus]|uniref:Uncharacterized protein n=1 Tax=Chloropicon primus TaxID=1764295 RepID=A0A5B8MMH5_9CHLO|nr:hypothetical protein A3770_04p30180 [Chloropicon primus]UPQ99710.1 hypothetical protein HOP50_04g30180 [Chloropicon primus]|eukprot:QDZ20500.1 hypothetical protein A3770_04p30180 [Chloropicon primus]
MATYAYKTFGFEKRVGPASAVGRRGGGGVATKAATYGGYGSRERSERLREYLQRYYAENVVGARAVAIEPLPVVETWISIADCIELRDRVASSLAALSSEGGGGEKGKGS